MNKEIRNELIELANAKMLFGTYKGWYLLDLPEYYLVWYKNKGFPKGKLGQQLQQIVEIKTNGLEELVKKLKN